MTPQKLSVLIPVYNERYYVGQLIGQVLAAPLPAGIERELVVVDDASTDGTENVLAEIRAIRPDVVRNYRHDRNQGKGAAIRTAIQHAEGDICIIQDADLEYDPNDYRALLEPIINGEADVVYGSRFLPGSSRRVQFFWHTMRNRFLTLVSNFFTDLALTDMESCYKAAKTVILKSIPVRSNRFGIEPELTAKFATKALVGSNVFEPSGATIAVPVCTP